MTWKIVRAAFIVAGLSIVPTGSGFAQITPSIHPELEAHSRLFEKRIYKIAQNVYSAVGWHIANTILVEGTDGVIIVDTGRSVENARLVEQEFRKISRKPLKAVIYTHFHPDHINGVRAYVSDEDVRSGRVQIYAHGTLVDNVVNQGLTMGPILSLRTAYSFGRGLPAADREGMNDGIGPSVVSGTATFIPPTLTIRDELRTTIAACRCTWSTCPARLRMK
jgi:alkyl sulfatase BDS1-like metallo-beta-lactamase superfamily hydrolase